MLKRALAATFALGLWGAPLQSAHARDILSVLPADTLAAIHVPDAHKLEAEWNATAPGKFYHDPAAQGFFAPGRAKLRGILHSLGAPNLTPEVLLDASSGSICLAALPNIGSTKDPESWVLIAETNNAAELTKVLGNPAAGDAKAQLKEDPAQTPGGIAYTLVRILRQEPVKNAAPKKKKKNKGLPNELLTIPGAQTAMRTVETNYARYSGDGLLILAEGKGKPIERILDRLKSGTADGGLHNNKGFAALAKTDEAAALQAFVNLASLAPGWERALDKSSGKGVLGADMSQLRLGEMQSAMLSFAQRGGAADVHVALFAPSPRSGVAQILYLHGPPPDAAQSVTAGAPFFGAHRLALDQVYDILMKTLMPAIPVQMLLVQSQIQTFEQQTGMNLRNDLIGSLGDQIAIVALPSAPTLGDTAPLENSAVLASVRDGEKLAKVLGGAINYFAQMYGAYSVQPVQYARGGHGWVLREGGQGRDPAQANVLAWIELTPQWLVVSSTRENIEAALAGESKSLAESATYRHAMAKLSPTRTGEVFGTPRAIFALFADALPAGDKKDPGWLDGGKLPDTHTFAQYFSPAVGERLVEGDVMQLHVILSPAK